MKISPYQDKEILVYLAEGNKQFEISHQQSNNKDIRLFYGFPKSILMANPDILMAN
jgi:hypothetical protein